MNRIPRLLPLVGVAIGGVLAVKALAEVDALPRAMAGARAFAEEVVAKPGKGAKAGKADKTDKVEIAAVSKSPAAPPDARLVPPTAPTASVSAVSRVCAPSPVDLAREAGLSPAELQVLQSLGARRTQLDQREADIDTQLKLLAAAEAKLDAKLKGLNGLKAELQVLLGQTEAKEQSEIDRLVIVFSKMKPRDAGPVMTQVEDNVRIPVAAKMKEAALAAILSQMPPAEAKKLTESLAHRYDKVQQLAQNAASANAAPAPAAPAPAPKAEPKPSTDAAEAAPAAKPPVRKRPVRRPAAKPAPAAEPKAVAEAAPAPATPAAPAPAAAAPPAPKPAG